MFIVSVKGTVSNGSKFMELHVLVKMNTKTIKSVKKF